MSPTPARHNLLGSTELGVKCLRGKQISHGRAFHCTPHRASRCGRATLFSTRHNASDQSACQWQRPAWPLLSPSPLHSTSMSRLNPPPPVLAIARRLEKGGFEAWCVGGAVRDAMLGHPHLDWDFATSATPDQVRDIFGKRRTIPVGIQFGTVGVLDEEGTL